jgi:hypothetical protein
VLWLIKRRCLLLINFFLSSSSSFYLSTIEVGGLCTEGLSRDLAKFNSFFNDFSLLLNRLGIILILSLYSEPFDTKVLEEFCFAIDF